MSSQELTRILGLLKRSDRLLSSCPTDDWPLRPNLPSILREARYAATQGRQNTEMKPIIGITPSAQLDTLAHGTFLRYCMSAPYVRAVETVRGVPVVLPPQRDAVDELMAVVDGLL